MEFYQISDPNTQHLSQEDMTVQTEAPPYLLVFEPIRGVLLSDK